MGPVVQFVSDRQSDKTRLSALHIRSPNAAPRESKEKQQYCFLLSILNCSFFKLKCLYFYPKRPHCPIDCSLVILHQSHNFKWFDGVLSLPITLTIYRPIISMYILFYRPYCLRSVGDTINLLYGPMMISMGKRATLRQRKHLSVSMCSLPV